MKHSSGEEFNQDIVDAFKLIFNKDGWNYEYNEELGIFNTAFKIPCKLGSIKLRVFIKNDNYTMYGVVNVHADNGSKAKVAEFLTRANYGLRHGNFEMDYADGEIRYKIHENIMDLSITPDHIRNSIIILMSTINGYGNALLKVLFGFAKPKEAIEEAENNFMKTNADDSSDDANDDDAFFNFDDEEEEDNEDEDDYYDDDDDEEEEEEEDEDDDDASDTRNKGKK